MVVILKHFFRFLLFTFSLSTPFVAPQLLAESLYVSDNLTIYMRRGPGTDFKIESSLRSGAKLARLGEENGWTKVRLPSGREGYVLTRQLQAEPVARDRFKIAEAKAAQAVAEAEEARLAAERLNTERNDLQQNRSSLERQNEELTRQLAELKQTASRTVEIQQVNEQLAGQVRELETQRDALSLKADALHDRTRKQWFLVGGGVLLLGIILGLLLPHVPTRRRHDAWSSL